MSRDLPAELVDAIEQPVVRPFLEIFIDLPDPVRVWTGQGTLQFDDSDGVEQEWLGAGGLGSIDTIGEATDGSATGMRVALFNVPSEFRDDIAEQATKGARFDVGVGTLNETYQQVAALKWLHKYRLDTYEITDSGETLTVEITGESRMRDQRRPAIKRFTAEYQERRHPGDRFFEYLPQMMEIPVLWAKADQSGPTGGMAGIGRKMLDM